MRFGGNVSHPRVGAAVLGCACGPAQPQSQPAPAGSGPHLPGPGELGVSYRAQGGTGTGVPVKKGGPLGGARGVPRAKDSHGGNRGPKRTKGIRKGLPGQTDVDNGTCWGTPVLKRDKKFTGNKGNPQGLLSASTSHGPACWEILLLTVSDLPPNPVCPGTEGEEDARNVELALSQMLLDCAEVYDHARDGRCLHAASSHALAQRWPHCLLALQPLPAPSPSRSKTECSGCGGFTQVGS